MTKEEIKAARKANRAAIDAWLKTYHPPAGHPPLPKAPGVLLGPVHRAIVAAAENAKPKPAGCCGH